LLINKQHSLDGAFPRTFHTKPIVFHLKTLIGHPPKKEKSIRLSKQGSAIYITSILSISLSKALSLTSLTTYSLFSVALVQAESVRSLRPGGYQTWRRL